jgi:conjugal transfer pilus assembly protein TraB
LDPATEPLDQSSKKRKFRQNLLWFGSLGVALAVISTLGIAATKEAEQAAAPVQKSTHQMQLADSAGGADAERAWWEANRATINALQKQVAALTAKLEAGVPADQLDIVRRQMAEDRRVLESDFKVAWDANQQQILSLEKELEDVRAQAAFSAQPPLAQSSSFAQAPLPPGGDPFRRPGQPNRSLNGAPAAQAGLAQNGETATIGGVQAVSFNLANKPGKPPVGRTHSVKDYVAAGSYARARVISGANASTGVAAQSEPRPVLLRITGPAVSVLENGEEKTTDIEGCSAIAEAHADLSSESVYARLLKLSCAAGKDLVREVDVQGYVAGVGRAGVRGLVVSREGELVTQAFAAGVLGGLGQSAAQVLNPNPLAGLTITNNGANSSSPTAGDVLKGGLGSGFGQAGDTVSNYLIKRAEQYQPVVVLQPGTDVEVVFLAGFYLDGRPVKPEIGVQANAQ